MVTDRHPQRAYRAACPNCGAPVEFRSPASAFAVCSYCRSNIVRDGETLRRIGHSAELFDDFSPLQLGASGSYQQIGFTLVGRLQYGTAQGTWNEWHVLFDDATAGEVPRVAWLSEDNGRYVLAFDAPLPPGAAPPLESLQVGRELELAGQRWRVASVVQAKLLAAEGELPQPPASNREFGVADLRNVQGEVATLDYSDPQRPHWSVGRSVGLSELAMRGLAEEREKTLTGRAADCPNCGSALQVKLESTKSIVCGNCSAVVDVSAGIGGDLQHYLQGRMPRSGPPRIPLGSVGNFTFDGKRPLPWQVVGFLERHDEPEAGDDQSSWREYLLYHRNAGFVFLVDSDDGWSWVTPITGVPQMAGSDARWRDVRYRKLYDYRARVGHVLGEFYWRVERNQLTHNTDYAGTGKASQKRLNRERGDGVHAQEIVWSAGETITADAVAQGFGMTKQLGSAIRRDVEPLSANPHGQLAKAFVLLFVIAFVVSMFRCSDDDDNCNELRATYGEASQEYQACRNRIRPRTGGAAFGGFGSGGFHK
ncbi:DUF4178 domain-containing protein [Piscinibacter sakaiensis]|uniref:DUF4178 domain-containing protein n=1 Tax=Piscinibacter sakaiensis TaxID=1547922 RepID=UPI003AAF249E